MSKSYDCLCFSGGGVCGVAYLGALKTLYRLGVTDWLSPQREVRTFLGTSVGALFALLTYAKVDLFMPQATQIVRDFLRLFQWNTDNLFTGARLGLGTGAKCIDFIEQLLYDRHGYRNMTLAQLKSLVGGDLVLVSSCVKTAEPIYFSHRTHPFVRVSDAVFASMAIPFLFQPHRIRVREEDVVFPMHEAYRAVLHSGQTFTHGDREYEIQTVDMNKLKLRAAKYRILQCIDGCFVCNNPFVLAPQGSRILNLVLKKTSKLEVGEQALFPYITRVLSLSVRRIEAMCDQVYGHLDRDVIKIPVDGISAVNFHVGTHELNMLMTKGADAVQQFVYSHTSLPFPGTGERAAALPASSSLAVGLSSVPSGVYQSSIGSALRTPPPPSSKGNSLGHLYAHRPARPPFPTSMYKGAPIRPVSTGDHKIDVDVLRTRAEEVLAESVRRHQRMEGQREGQEDLSGIDSDSASATDGGDVEDEGEGGHVEEEEEEESLNEEGSIDSEDGLGTEGNETAETRVSGEESSAKNVLE